MALSLTSHDSPCLGLGCLVSEIGIGVNNIETSKVPLSSEALHV